MAAITQRQASVRHTTAVRARVRCVKVACARDVHTTPVATFAAATALLLSGAAPSYAFITSGPVFDVAIDPVGKILNKLDSLDPPKGVKGPDVPGQFRSNPDKARALAAENSPAGSPEAEARGALILEKDNN